MARSRQILNGIGHNVPQEDPHAFAKVVIEVAGYEISAAASSPRATSGYNAVFDGEHGNRWGATDMCAGLRLASDAVDAEVGADDGEGELLLFGMLVRAAGAGAV